MALRQSGINQSFGRAQVIENERYTSPAWEYHIANKTALKKKMSVDRAEFEEFDDLKAWEDDRNFREITGGMRNLEEIWNQSFQAGYNIANPTTEKEQLLAKKFAQEKDRVKQASDLYTRQGAAVKSAWEAMQREDVDKVKTKQKIMDYIDYEGDIFERAKQVPGLVVHKTEPMDILETITGGVADYTKVTKDVLENAFDPLTGKIKKKTWEGISTTDRKDALEKIWLSQKAMGDEFREGIADIMRSDIKNNLDPNKEENVHKYYSKEFLNVKSGSKVEETFYSVGEGGLKISIGSGIPKKDEQGMFIGNPDTVLLYNDNADSPIEHTSPFAVNLQGVFKNTPSSSVAIDVTEDFVNTQDGMPEVKAGNYSVLPMKIIWLPVGDEDVDLNKEQSPWMGPIQSIFRPMNTFKDKPIGDEQFAELEKINDKLTGSGKRINYSWMPYFLVRMKYGQVEQGDDISSFNRSDYVPYSVIKDDVKAKVGGMKDVSWDEYEQTVNDITNQMNKGIFDPRQVKKKKLDY